MTEHNPKRSSWDVARCPGTSWQDIAAEDSNPVPDFLVEDHYEFRGNEPIAASRYTDPAFAKLENERMWPAVWQFAARDEEMPDTGDYVVYENAGRSFLLVRQEDGSVRAFHNVCLHRGRKLRTEDGNADTFRCPFHGFTWNADGSFKEMPCQWDFRHLSPEKLQLPEAQVARWQGYIFLRENHEGPSLEEYLAPMPEHFKRWNHDECTTVVWVGKVVPANWKVVMEAFMEAWHSVITHPQLLPFTGDANSMYNIYGDHVNLTVTPFGVMSPHVNPTDKTQQWIVDEFVKYNGRSSDNYDQENDAFNVTVPEGKSARAALGDALRETTSKMLKRDLSFATDCEMMDSILYNVFPHFAPWAGFMPNIVYRWRPWHDADHCLMETRILSRVPKGEKKPRSVPMHFLSLEQPWTDAPELGILGDVFEQDMENLPHVQTGLKCSKNGLVNFATYQEIEIRQFHQTLDKYLARS